MQIILMEKVANVGNLGDVVKVKDGYARNFLIPQGKARRATPDNVKLLESKRAELEKAANEKLVAAQADATKLEGAKLSITQKAGVDGRLFGSVTNVDIVEALKGKGITVEKSSIRMPNGPLKQVGDHEVTVALHTDVTASIVVTVVGDTGTRCRPSGGSGAGKPCGPGTDSAAIAACCRLDR
jgi:large subunit ribosomal protein L9